jgi:hypothetical protein
LEHDGRNHEEEEGVRFESDDLQKATFFVVVLHDTTNDDAK